MRAVGSTSSLKKRDSSRMEISLSKLYQFEERENSSENSGDNSPSTKRRREIQKRIVTVPIKDLEVSRFKGDCTPPSDSWAWRKYGQKPIKGSPYPRGYYRCSSSKGCPARKQVERSRSDPSMLVVTYSYEHNHPWPTSRNNHQNRHHATTTTTTSSAAPSPLAPSINILPKIENPNGAHIEPPSLVPTTEELGWFNSDHHHHQFPDDDYSILTSCSPNNLDMTKILPMGEEEESLFADLGELPECSVVFRPVEVAVGGEKWRWCGTTG